METSETAGVEESVNNPAPLDEYVRAVTGPSREVALQRCLRVLSGDGFR